MSSISTLKSAHRWLRGRIEELKHLHGEDRPIFLIEHGLPEEILDDIAARLADRLRRCLLDDSPYWRDRYYALLLLCTEYGYRFGGSGREFWPPLEERLGRSFRDSERTQIRLYFNELKHHTHVEPPSCPWTEQFCIIAWPITHAVLPLELHVPLLRAVLSLSRSITDKTPDADIIEPLMSWAEQGKVTRLQNLLHQRTLAADIVRGLLWSGYRPQVIDALLLERIVRDLHQSREALRALHEVQSQQAHLRMRGQGGASSGAPAPPGVASPQYGASLVLRAAASGQVELWVAPPPLSPELAQEVRALSRVLQPRLLGARRPILARQLLGSQELRVTTSALPEQDTDQPSRPLFEPESLRDLSNQQVSLQLGAIEVDLRRPILFEERVGDSLVAVQRRRRDYTAQSVLWALAEEAPDQDGVTSHGQVCGLSCLRLDLSCAGARQWLEEQGVHLVPSPRVEILSSPPLSMPGSAALAPGDLLALQVRDHAVLVSGDGADEEIAPGLWLVPLPRSPGDYAIPLQAQGGKPEALSISVQAPLPREELIRLRLRGSLSVTALRRGQLHLTLDSDLAIEDLRVTLSLWHQGRCVAQVRTLPLPALPQPIGTGAPAWSSLVSAAEARFPDLWQRALVLRAEVGGLAERQWWLEPELTQIWWQVSGDGMAKAESDHGEVSLFSLTAAQPLQEIPAQISPDVAGCVVLCQPQESAEDSRPLIGSGICLVPKKLSLERSSLEAPRILRRLEAGGAPGESVAHLVEIYLCWATSSGQDLVAEGARRRVVEQIEQWTVEALCGEAWSREEQELIAGERLRLGSMMFRQLRAAGLLVDDTADGYLRSKAPEIWEDVLERRLSALLEKHQHLLLEPDGSVEQLNEIFNQGYCDAIREVLQLPDGEPLPDPSDSEPDIYLEPGELLPCMHRALRRWRERAELRPLLGRIYPARHAQELAGLPPEDPTALREFLDSWLRGRDRIGLRWTPEDTSELLSLWLSPSEVGARTPRLREALEKALIDRGAARALRYSVLRYREALSEQR